MTIPIRNLPLPNASIRRLKASGMGRISTAFPLAPSSSLPWFTAFVAQPGQFFGNSLRATVWQGLLAVMVVGSGLPRATGHGTHSALMTALEACLAERPDDGGLWYRRALLEIEHTDWAAASHDLDRAEILAPGEYPVQWWQGKILDQQGKPLEAKAALDAFLKKHPAHWGALASRARVETQLGMEQAALEDFQAALANQADAEPDLIQEAAQALASHGKTDESVRVLEGALARLGNVPSLQLKLVEIEVNATRFESALARLPKFQQSAPRPEPWMEKRARILAEAGRVDESMAAWRSLIEHLKGLPAAERGSHSMSLLSERARQAMAALTSCTQPAAQPAFTFPHHP